MLINIIKRDLKIGIGYNIFKNIYVVLIVIFTSIYLFHAYEIMQYFTHASGTINYSNILLFCFIGEAPFKFDIHSGFGVPVMWLCTQLGAHYIVAYYAEKDLKENGRYLLIATKSRAKLWVGKLVWCFCTIITYFITIFISVAGIVVVSGKEFSLDYKNSVAKDYVSSNIEYVSLNDIFLLLTVIILMTFGIAVVQMALSLIFDSITSFVIVCILYISSSYYMLIWLPASFTMLKRSSYLINGGLAPGAGITIALSLIIVGTLMGIGHLNSKDIL